MLLNVVLEKTVESPLDSKEIKPVYPKGNQSRLFIERSDAEAETPILWPPDAKNWLIGKDPDAGKDWTQEEKGMAEDEMVGWHHWLTGHESEQAPRVGDGQGSLMICAPWGRKESDVTEQLNLCMQAESLQCPTFCDPMECSPPDSSVHRSFHTRILEWVPRPSSKGSSQPRDGTCISYVSCIGRQVLYH